VREFVEDTRPDAFERVVDRLLASPHYGEKWARHWLDVVRFAESQGFKDDGTRPNAWRYRDYVIRSFNDDKPYDRFVREQIAGDELWPADPEARVATAFARHYPDEYNARNLMQRRQEILNDITNVVGSAFLGLTLECAQCHDHKFDPIKHSDYFSIQAFFAGSVPDDNVVMLSPAEYQAYQKKLAVWEGKTREIRERIAEVLAPERKAFMDELFDKYPVEVQEALSTPPSQRDPYQWQLYHQAEMYFLPTEQDAARRLKGEKKAKYQALKQELEKFADLHPGELPVGTGMRDLGAQAPMTWVLAGGVYTNHQEPVDPGFLAILDPEAPAITPLGLQSSGRRTALANWLASEKNPLTARVMVNRIWHHHFGRGLMTNPGDFGMMGGRPSHPELLDWLANEFVSSGWSMKHLHRLIVTSSAYRQASDHREEMAKADPSGRFLWRYPRNRLEAEVIRDSAIHVAGALNAKAGGPSVFPQLPAGMPTPRGGWDKTAHPEDNYRRSVYIFVRRNTPYPMLKALDFPDANMSCSHRASTVTAPQALSLLNSNVSVDWARKFAGRVLREADSNESKAIEQAFLYAFSRRPDGWEKDTVQTFLARQSQIIAKRLEAGEDVELPEGVEAGDRARLAALVDFCHTLLNSNEFVFRN
jgi:hypothetical protein